MTITHEEAANAVLDLIQSDLIPEDLRHGNPGLNIQEIHQRDIYSQLSSGERALVHIARTIWNGDTQLSSIDRGTCRHVLRIYAELYLDEVNTVA